MREAARTCHETALRISRRRVTLLLVPLSLAGICGVLVASFGEISSKLSQAVQREAATTALTLALASLPTRQQVALAARYGLDGREPETLQDLADRLGITREAVRQLQARALEALQRRRSLSRAV
jgi:RNA polymerase sigma factor (sigma-70 family)